MVLASLFYSISNFVVSVKPKLSLLKNSTGTYLGRKGFINFSEGISPKENVRERLVFELGYYNIAVHRFSQFIPRNLATSTKKRINV